MQRSLNFAPATHRRDPQTSRAAEAAHTASGARGRHLDDVLSLVRAHPGLTARELTALPACRYDLTEVRRRLTDGLHARLLRQGPARRAAGATRDEVTWEWRAT